MGNLRFTVLSADGRTIRLLRVAPLDADSDSETTDG
jgi:magnesium and cobalt transporter